MLYPSSVIHTPARIIAKYKGIILGFIWNGKPPKVKYSAIINEIHNGGLWLQDLETKIQSLHVRWTTNINDKECKTAWKTPRRLVETNTKDI